MTTILKFNKNPFKKGTLLTTAQAATLMEKSMEALVIARAQGRGLPFVKIGRSVYYRTCDVAAWLMQEGAKKGGSAA